MRLYIFRLLFLCPVLFFQVLKAQLPGMKVYTQLDGYPGTTGYHISQDAKGFIWVGTDNGAVCFDGKRFEVIDDKNGLRDKEIIQALPYGNDNVLLTPLLNNIAYYKNGKVITSQQNKTLDFITNTTTNTCRFDNVTQKAWLGDASNEGFLYCFSFDSVQKVNINVPIKFQLLSAINDRLYLALFTSPQQFEGYGYYDVKSHEYVPFKLIKNNAGKAVEMNWLTTTKLSNDGKFLVAFNVHDNSLDIFEVNKDELYYKQSVTLKKSVRFFSIDKNNHLWIAFTSSGIEYWGSLPDITPQSRPFNLLENIIVNDLLVDREGHIWFTTDQKGLCFISYRHWENAKLTFQYKLQSVYSRCIAGNGKNTLYIGFNNVPGFICIKNGEAKVFNIPNDLSLSSGIRRIITHGNQVFFITGMLARYKDTGRAMVYEKYWLHGAIKDIAFYHNNIILAEHSSVSMVNAETGGNAGDEFINLFSNRSTAVNVLKNGTILIGTPNGLFFKSSVDSPAINIKNSVLSKAYITEIKNFNNNYVLIGTNAQGLFGYNFFTGKVLSVALPGDHTFGTVRSIYRQNDTLYWIATDKGLNRIYFDEHLNVKTYSAFSFFDGLPSSDVSSVYVQNDTAYIATTAGIGIIPLKKTAPAKENPVLWITQARVEDSLIHFPKEKILLSYNKNNIQLSVSAISFESFGKIKYVYRLLGLNDKWIETESPEISFSGLSPGDYQLEAYAVNFRGIKSKSPLLISIIVSPAFWQTAWFKLLVSVLAGSLLLFIIYRLIIGEKNKQYKKMQQKKRLAELELEAIKAQINPHFVYNCLNSIQYFSYKNDFEPVKQYLDIFAKLIRQTMQYSQETFITLEEEINYLNNYLKLEKVRFKDKLLYHFDIAADIDPSAMMPSMLVQPYVENAMKHGVAKVDNTGEVWISFTRAPGDCIKVTIEDNGPGLQKNADNTRRKPLGLRITGTRAETYNQLFGLNIRISMNEPGNAKGTKVELLIPPVHGHAKL